MAMCLTGLSLNPYTTESVQASVPFAGSVCNSLRQVPIEKYKRASHTAVRLHFFVFFRLVLRFPRAMPAVARWGFGKDFMKTATNVLLAATLLALLSAPAFGTVAIVSMTPSKDSPQSLGTTIQWNVKAVDSKPGPLMFQFSVQVPHQPMALVKDFNVGHLKSKVWTSQHFDWSPSFVEGLYVIQVVVKDFQSGEMATQMQKFELNPLVTGSTPVVAKSINPLVAIFAAPACPLGSSMRVTFQPQDASLPAMNTSYVACHAPGTMNFRIAGMYPSTTYNMFSTTLTGSATVNGPTVTYTTGALPTTIKFPTFKTVVSPGSQADTTDNVLLHSTTHLGNAQHFPDTATDLTGKIIWYYNTKSGSHANVLTRPLQNGGVLSLEDGPSWNPTRQASQLIRQIGLEGNVLRETNTGIIQQQLLAKGDSKAGPCNVFPKPAPVGSACLGAFHHEAIQNLPNGYTAVLADIEQIFPAGTQGDTSGLPVDIMGDIIIVLDNNFQVTWYFDTFDHDEGPPSTELDINRPAVLGETCVNRQGGCPPMYLLGTGIAPKAHDWLHANSIYYWPQTHDLIWSSRHQDWVMRIDYQDGAGTGNILWRMGPDGDFTFNNIYGDQWPWFSHQHDVNIANAGAGVMTVFDNGNTRITDLGSNCKPDCNSRGMALNFDETSMQVTPVLSQDLGYFSTAMGSAQLLSDGNYFFVPAIVPTGVGYIDSYNMEILPGTSNGSGRTVFNIRGSEVYRGWQMQDLYTAP
jgi:arylsulfate sulfotransferase